MESHAGRGGLGGGVDPEPDAPPPGGSRGDDIASVTERRAARARRVWRADGSEQQQLAFKIVGNAKPKRSAVLSSSADQASRPVTRSSDHALDECSPKVCRQIEPRFSLRFPAAYHRARRLVTRTSRRDERQEGDGAGSGEVHRQGRAGEALRRARGCVAFHRRGPADSRISPAARSFRRDRPPFPLDANRGERRAVLRDAPERALAAAPDYT